MHTGGAALDGYLALSIPFVASWLLMRQTRLRTGAAIILLALGAYAGLTTFSRGLYAAYAVAALIIASFLINTALKKSSVNWWRCLGGSIFAALIVYGLVDVFASSGYRGLAAALILLLAAAVLAARTIPWKLLPATLLCAIAIEIVFGAVLSFNDSSTGIVKPPYLLFMLSSLTFGAAAGARGRAASPLLIAFCCLALSTTWVAVHWGGPKALAPIGLIVIIAVALVVWNATAGVNRWQVDRSSLAMVAAGAVVLALVIPISGSYYASERFGSTGEDLQVRVRHWSQTLNMMERDAQTQIFGMGLGKFPITYFWRNPSGDVPGSLRYVDEVNNRYVQLTAPQYARGYGEVLRLLQRLPIRPGTRYVLALDIRRNTDKAVLQVQICERLLLYTQNCVAAPLRLLAPDRHWQHYTVKLDSASLGAEAWPLRAPTQLEISTDGAHSSLDIDNISLREENSDSELIHNGAFSDGNNYWFFSSDHSHLPWSIENLALNVYFELGWLGVVAFLSLLLYVFARLARQARAGNSQAAVYLAGLTGFLTVGLFGSLLDVPRVSLLFFIVLLVVLMQPSNVPARPSERLPL